MTAKITPAEDGPLIVNDPPGIETAEGQTLEKRPRVALCRCGHSAKKPYCDGSHAAVGFTSDNDGPPKRNAAVTYTAELDGVPVTVSYTPVICSHAARCVDLGEGAFDPQQKPWADPGKTSVARLREVVAACPSGALRLAVGAGPVSHSNPPHDAEGIRIEKDGPYYVQNVALEADFVGAEASTQKYALCRCGLSSIKPFCDGSHRDAGWTDEG